MDYLIPNLHWILVFGYDLLTDPGKSLLCDHLNRANWYEVAKDPQAFHEHVELTPSGEQIAAKFAW